MADSVSVVIAVLFIVGIIALVVWPYSRIFRKAGFSPWLGLLMLVPGVNLFMIFFLAFADWPALKR
jgi:hypothetical protein